MAIGRGIATALIVAIVCATARASTQTIEVPQFSPEEIAAFAKKVERELATRGARVAIISRTGRPPDELPEGIEFTHVGFAVYSRITTTDGRNLPGYAMYNLYQDNDTRITSFLHQDYVFDYYAAVYRLRAGVIIPTPELQRRLLKVIFSDSYRKLHNREYSAISNPFNGEYQNCTEFVLDVINAAIYETDDQKQLKANSKAYFKPQPVNVSPFRLFLGSLFAPDIILSDHDGPVETATFGSIARYLQGSDAASEVFEVSGSGIPP